MRCDVVSFGTISVHYVQPVQQISVCMQGSRECCPVCVHIPELFIRGPTAARYATKCCVTSRDTSAGRLGTFQASNIGEWYTEKFLRSSSIILATLNFLVGVPL